MPRHELRPKPRRTSTLRVAAPTLRSPVLLALLGLLFTTEARAVGTRRFVLEKEVDFTGGELAAVAVDSRGELRAGLDLAKLEAADAATAWSAVEFDGKLLVATGNDGRLLRVDGAAASVVASVDALLLSSVVIAWGKPVVAAVPGGKLFTLEGDKLVEFAKLDGAPHIWAMAFDADAGALYVATGPDGKLFRVTRDGTAQVYFDSDQSHLVSVAVGGGKVFAGSSGKARLYRLEGPGRASTLYDFERTEVRAIVARAEGSVLAVANELPDGPRSDAPKRGTTAGPSRAAPRAGKGVLYAFSPAGEPERLFESDAEHFVSLALDGSGLPLVGTGVEGRLYQVGANRQSALLADVDSRQVVWASVRGAKGWVLASDPVVVHPVRGLGGADSAWTSKVLDAGLRARFGKADWDAVGDVRVETRSGATAEPDDSWSAWSAALRAPGQVTSPAARFLQLRVTLGGAGASLRRLEVPFLTDNARAVVTEVEVDSRARGAGSRGVVQSGQPVEPSRSTSLEVEWQVDNPDKDELRYYVEYRALGSAQWFDALEPGAVHTKEKLDWKTEHLPEGKYVLRVTATDELSNPPDRVKRHTAESGVALVDNTAPRLERLAVRGRTVSGVAVDKLGPIRRLELRVGGRSEWLPFEPTDGIFDEPSEEFSLDLGAVAPEGPAQVTLRAFDAAGNTEVAYIELPGR